MKNKINFKRLVPATIIVMIINMLIGNFLYLNPLVSGIFSEYSAHPSIRPMDDFGGTANYVLLTLGFSFLLDIFFIFLFTKIKNSLPGNSVVKGLVFGLCIAAVKAVPEAFNQFMNFRYPGILILIQLINTIIGVILFGMYLSVIFAILKVFRSNEAMQ